MTQQTEQSTVWLTQDAYDKLQRRAGGAQGSPSAQEIVAKISAARDEGDLKENGGYHAAREEQGKHEGRIRQLEAMLQQRRGRRGAGRRRHRLPRHEGHLQVRRRLRRRGRDVPPRRPRDGGRRGGLKVYSPQSAAGCGHHRRHRRRHRDATRRPTARRSRSSSWGPLPSRAEQGRPVRDLHPAPEAPPDRWSRKARSACLEISRALSSQLRSQLEGSRQSQNTAPGLRIPCGSRASLILLVEGERRPGRGSRRARAA